jgi:hypothetical protein
MPDRVLDRMPVAARLQHFFAVAALMDASIEYTERLIAWWSKEPLAPTPQSDDVGHLRAPRHVRTQRRV